ncbi:MAG: hypothetical protein QG669_445 [Patescibacteria group bacterium]|jgi:GH25 family lysozyme M1 (1,4-beta-N-acetylmuramidase)|nr:hypothetical protein [Patescibacteria group bacterium]
MFEKFSPEGNNDNDIQSKMDVNKAHSDFVREKLSDPDLSDAQRKALREILIENGIKIGMYEQFQNSINTKSQDAKVIEMKPEENGDEESNRFRKAI